MAGAGFPFIAKFRAQILTLSWQIAVCAPRIATTKNVVLQTAKVRSLNLMLEPPAGFVLGLRVGIGNPHPSELFLAVLCNSYRAMQYFCLKGL
jgi:hypothetical protein